ARMAEEREVLGQQAEQRVPIARRRRPSELSVVREERGMRSAFTGGEAPVELGERGIEVRDVEGDERDSTAGRVLDEGEVLAGALARGHAEERQSRPPRGRGPAPPGARPPR